jgi:nucleotide-binding universal stress UspA family protein
VTSALAVVIAVWLVVGLLTGVAMGRRGHSWFGWTVIGCGLGPLVIPVALASVGRLGDTSATPVSPGEQGRGRLRVMVGVDAVRPDGKGEGQQQAKVALAEAADVARGASGRAAETVMLTGAPAGALLDHATATGADLLVIGSRGRGASRKLLGSVATQLAGSAAVPVLVVGRGDERRAGRSPRRDHPTSPIFPLG